MSSPAPHDRPSACRFCGFDWLRVVACLLVVAFHAGIPYMSSPLPSLKWCTDDHGARSHVVDAVNWGADTFMMPVFFLMGGFLACQSCRKIGPGAFLRQKSVRLGIPLVIAAFLIMPAVLYIWLFGWMCAGELTPQQLTRLKLTSPQWTQLRCAGHLWFLIDLWLFCLAAAAAVTARNLIASMRSRREPATLPLPSAKSSRWSPGRLAVVAGLFAISVYGLYCEPRTAIGFKFLFFPRLPHVLYYAPCFLLGWLMQSWKWTPGRATPALLLSGAALLFPGLWGMISRHVATPFSGTELVWLVATFAACGWLAASGLFAWALRYDGSLPRPIAYLSRASLWIYLAHVPPMALLQISFRAISGYGLLKAVAAGALSLIYVLVVYEFAIRGQRLDALLNGCAPKPASTPVPGEAAEPEATRKSAA